MTKDNVGSIDDLPFLKAEASKKGFTDKEVGVLKTVYDIAMGEYVSKHPYSVYRENTTFDRLYFDSQRHYAAAKAREYIGKTIDEWHVKKEGGV